VNKVLKKSGSTMLNLLRGLKSKHGINVKSGTQAQTLITDHVAALPVYQSASTKKKDGDRLVALFIAEDMRPISIVEGKGFKKMMLKMDPRYQLPSRRTISKKIIPSLTEEEKSRVCNNLKNAEAVALTTDAWSSITCTSFMAVTSHFLDNHGTLCSKMLDCSRFHQHHTAENIKTRLLEVIAWFDLSMKVVCVVMDNAANVKKAVVESGFPNLPCFAHTLNLIVTDAFKNFEVFEPLRQRIAALAMRIHCSNNAKEDFIKTLERLGKPMKMPIQDVKTRWNSVFQMLDRFMELQEVIVLFSTTESAKTSPTPTMTGSWPQM
jgi:hypothetical protein